MKKYLLATTAAGAALAITAPANAGNYLSLFGGYSMSDQTASARIGQNSGTFGNTTSTTGYNPAGGSHTHVWLSYTGYHFTLRPSQ